MTSEMTKPKRCCFRFSLRTLLVVLTLLCVWFGWQVHRAKQQREAVEWVEKMGGRVVYDYEFEKSGWEVPNNAQPPGPKWLREILGKHLWDEVHCVIFANRKVNDLAPLEKLASLQAIVLVDTRVIDFSQLENFKRLKVLWLEGTTYNSKEPVKALRHALPNCLILWSPPSDDESP